MDILGYVQCTGYGVFCSVNQYGHIRPCSFYRLWYIL